jgi:hypothetical protein
MGIHKFDEKMDITYYEHYKSVSSKLVSLIRKLEETLGKEKAHKIVSEWAEMNAIEDLERVMDEEKNPIESFEDVKVLLRRWVADLDKNIESVSITEETSSKSLCIVKECIHAKIFNELGAPDIGYLLYCKHDFPATPVIHPKMKLRRDKTVMEGHECCNFEYYWEE